MPLILVRKGFTNDTVWDCISGLVGEHLCRQGAAIYPYCITEMHNHNSIYYYYNSLVCYGVSLGMDGYSKMFRARREGILHWRIYARGSRVMGGRDG